VSDSASRTAILDAAEQLFARQGFRGTTIKQIAAAAGVNSALLYYYFADKETLYREVLGRLIRSFGDAGVSLLHAGDGPDGALRRFVEGVAEFMLGRPHAPRLLARELADHQMRHAEPEMLHINAGMYARLCDVIRYGQHEGVFRADLDPRFAAVSTVSQIAWMLVARPAIGILLGEGIGGTSDATVRSYAQHVVAFTLAGLRPGSPVAPAPRPPPQRRAPTLSREDAT
jgi:TetR/AcrR family transcriptional regulator